MTTVVRKLTIFHIIVGILTACGGRGSGSDTAKTPADATFKVALLTPGPISDQGWNGSAYAGLMRVKDSLGAQTSHIQTKTPAEFEENFRQYGSSGYALVFGHGFEFQDAASRVAPEFRPREGPRADVRREKLAIQRLVGRLADPGRERPRYAAARARALEHREILAGSTGVDRAIPQCGRLGSRNARRPLRCGPVEPRRVPGRARLPPGPADRPRR